jgi:hypothetical protein
MSILAALYYHHMGVHCMLVHEMILLPYAPQSRHDGEYKEVHYYRAKRRRRLV